MLVVTFGRHGSILSILFIALYGHKHWTQVQLEDLAYTGYFNICSVESSVRKNWRYQRGNVNRRADNTMAKKPAVLMCSGRVSSSFSICDTHRVTIVINHVISHEWGNDLIVTTTNGKYPSSFLTQLTSVM